VIEFFFQPHTECAQTGQPWCVGSTDPSAGDEDSEIRMLILVDVDQNSVQLRLVEPKPGTIHGLRS